jgi:hypothetical protein
MDKHQRFLDYMTRSALGLTLLTIAVLITIVGFFFQDIQWVDVDAKHAKKSEPVVSEVASWTEADEPVAEAAVQPAERYSENLASLPNVERPSSRPAAGVASLPNLSSGYVAMLTRTCDCRWDDATGPQDGAQLKVGQTLKIAAGLAEIAFGCGAKAILEGPAVLEIQSVKSGALQVGKLTADVPDEVEGFTVHSPVVQIVSLGSSREKSVAKLSAAVDCAWAKDSAVTKEGASLSPGQTVRLTTGLAEVTFANGAKIILQGPANLEIESAKTAVLHNGRMTADVPDDLEGFKVRTAVAEIVSLQAEPKPAKGPAANAEKRT